MRLLSLAIALIVVACTGPNDPEALAKTKTSFANPSYVGTLPDGRVVKFVKVNRGDSEHAHFVYFVENSTEVTANRTVSSGKTGRNEVTSTLISVKPYIRKK